MGQVRRGRWRETPWWAAPGPPSTHLAPETGGQGQERQGVIRPWTCPAPASGHVDGTRLYGAQVSPGRGCKETEVALCLGEGRPASGSASEISLTPHLAAVKGAEGAVCGAWRVCRLIYSVFILWLGGGERGDSYTATDERGSTGSPSLSLSPHWGSTDLHLPFTHPAHVHAHTIRAHTYTHAHPTCRRREDDLK